MIYLNKKVFVACVHGKKEKEEKISPAICRGSENRESFWDETEIRFTEHALLKREMFCDKFVDQFQNQYRITEQRYTFS